MSLRLGTTLIAGLTELSEMANTDLSNLSATGQAVIDGKASTSLSNLTSTGKNISTWSTNITNCITEIPQDINLTLSSGTLTLKAGSKVYIPNGFEQDGTTPKFDTETTSSDITFTYATDGQYILRYEWGSLVRALYPATSGSTQPTASFGVMWYDTERNRCYRCYDGSEWSWGSFPLAIITVSNSAISSIDRVFNGFGYVGSTLFALPGVKGLIPNGRNDDGTLKNKEFTINSVMINSSPGSGNRIIILNPGTSDGIFGRTPITVYVSDSRPTMAGTSQQQYWINPSENLIYKTMDTGTTWTPSDTIILGSYNLDTTISDFKTKTVFNSLDYNDTDIVHKSGAEIITGSKSITGKIVLKTTNTTVPNNSLYGEMAQQGNSYFDLIGLYDTTNSCRCATIRAYNKPDVHGILLAAHNFNNGSPNGIDVAFDDSNNLTTKAHTPSSATNNSTEIATTAWVYNHEAVAVDGQWVNSFYNVADGVSGTDTYSTDFDLSSYLPNDGQIYEVLVNASGRTGTTSGNELRILIKSSMLDGDGLFVVCTKTRTSSYVDGAGCGILPIGTNRKITMKFAYSSGTNTNVRLDVLAYRRVGTNS